jgi:hypothetical protein
MKQFSFALNARKLISNNAVNAMTFSSTRKMIMQFPVMEKFTANFAGMSILLTANTATNTAILKTLFIWSIQTNGGVGVVLNVTHINVWIALTG